VQTSLATCLHKSSNLCLPHEDLCLPREDMCLPREHMCLPREDMCLPREHMCLPREDMCSPHEDMCLPREDMCLPREDSASETATVFGKGGHCHGQNAADNPRRQHQRGCAHVANMKEGVRMRVDGWAYLNPVIARNSEEHRFGKNLLLYILLHCPAPEPECMRKRMHVSLSSKTPLHCYARSRCTLVHQRRHE
jgi:hypothetical protein